MFNRGNTEESAIQAPNAAAVLHTLAEQVDPDILTPYSIQIMRQNDTTYVARIVEHREGDYEGYVVSLQ